MQTVDSSEIKRWRLILGPSAQEALDQYCEPNSLTREESEMDAALAAIYDDSADLEAGGKRSAGLGASAPRLARWLGDIRTYFREDVVAVIQQDAIERKGLTQLLLEPETLKHVQPSVQLVGTLMSLSEKIPERTKETARAVVRVIVDQIKLELEHDIRQGVLGALNRRSHSPLPHASTIDWKWTLGKNLKNYRPELETIVPERVYFFARGQRSHRWTVIVDLDQSGSMAESVVYGAVMASIFASLPVLKTHLVAFDTQVVDLTERYGNDPVSLLLGVQLGGGTDINKSVAYCQQFIEEPQQTLFIMITDLYEGGNQAQLVRRLTDLVASGVRCLCLLALNYSGNPSYDHDLAKKLAEIGIPCFACSPSRLPELLERTLRGDDLQEVANRISRNSKGSPG